MLAACAGGEVGAVPGPAADNCIAIPTLDDRCESWTLRYDEGGTGEAAGSHIDGAGVMTPSADGRTLYTLGFVDRDPGSGWQMDALLFANATDTGAVRFVARYPGSPTLDQALPVALALGHDGTVLYALFQEMTDAFSSGECAQALLALDPASGEVQWSARETGLEGSCSDPYDLAVDPAGARVYVVGTRYAEDGKRVGLVTAYETEEPEHIGERSWQAVVAGSAGTGLASAAAPAPDGSRVYVAGSTEPDPLGRYATGNYALLGFDAEDGARSLEAASPVQGNPPAGVVLSEDGGSAFVVGGGVVNGLPTFDIVTTAFDTATGTVSWQANYEGRPPEMKQGFDSVWYHGPMVLSPDGRTVHVAGYSVCLYGVNLCSDLVTLAYDAATGSQRWAERYGVDMDMNWLPQIAVHPDGSTVYAAGESRVAAATKNARVTTLAYDAVDGDQQWVGRHSNGQTFFSGAAIAPDGSGVFVAGLTADLEDNNVQTAYDALILAYAT